ncbi:hypothetical protein SEVIR_8G104351v4 [Setaria viridis]
MTARSAAGHAPAGFPPRKVAGFVRVLRLVRYVCSPVGKSPVMTAGAALTWRACWHGARELASPDREAVGVAQPLPSRSLAGEHVLSMAAVSPAPPLSSMVVAIGEGRRKKV